MVNHLQTGGVQIGFSGVKQGQILQCFLAGIALAGSSGGNRVKRHLPQFRSVADVINPFPEKSRLLGVLLYNKVDSDIMVHNYETMTAHLSYMYRTNLRFMGELSYDNELDDTRLTFGYMAGF